MFFYLFLLSFFPIGETYFGPQMYVVPSIFFKLLLLGFENIPVGFQKHIFMLSWMEMKLEGLSTKLLFFQNNLLFPINFNKFNRMEGTVTLVNWNRD